jgi:hypothetical protein
VLGKISAPPATPELIAMLSESTEAVRMAQAGATIADEYSRTEKARLDGLTTSLVVSRMKERAETRAGELRSFIEKMLTSHVRMTSPSTVDWRLISSGSYALDDMFGVASEQARSNYGFALLTLVEKFKASNEPPIEAAKKYFAASLFLADKSLATTGSSVDDFRVMVVEDRNDFLGMLADYQESLADIADKETEYILMIGEKKAMLEKDRLMAYAEADAKEDAYRTVSNEIKGGLYIVAPRGGTISAIYKNVGDLVDPAMKIATIAGGDMNSLLVRMRIPNNIRKPSVGELVFVVRPGFSADKRTAKITGVGSVLDEDGSYMADATLTEKSDWSAGIAVRVIPSQNLETPMIQFSAVWWSKTGLPHVWGVSEAGRIFARKITIGRTVGSSVEVYDGIKNGDSYIVTATPAIAEDMLISDVPHENVGAGSSDAPKEKKPMGGMEM